MFKHFLFKFHLPEIWLTYIDVQQTMTDSRNTNEDVAIRSLDKWRIYHTQAKVNDLAKALLEIKRFDIIKVHESFRRNSRYNIQKIVNKIFSLYNLVITYIPCTMYIYIFIYINYLVCTNIVTFWLNRILYYIILYNFIYYK